MKQVKLFLVEDEAIIREGIRDGVDWSAHALDFVGDAPDGEIALGQIRKLRPDIVITDIRMPFMDGLELSRHIREELPDTEIIVLSGHEEFSYAKECISIGVSDYLLKPISREDLLEKVDEIADRVRARLNPIEEIEGSGITTEVKEKIIEFLRFGAEDEIDGFLDWLENNIGEESLKSQVFRQYVTMDFYLTVKGYLDEIAVDDETKELIAKRTETNDITKFGGTPEQAREFVRDLLADTVKARQIQRGSRQSETVDKVIRYVHENYKDEDLSLNQVAEYVGFSANHLSTVFHQEYGQSFVKYLTDYRMNKAKKLLVETNMRQSEICYEVGYKDPHYFSSIFKKTQGVTPTQYREGQRL